MNHHDHPPTGPGNPTNNEVVPYSHQNYTQSARQQVIFVMSTIQKPGVEFAQGIEDGNQLVAITLSDTASAQYKMPLRLHEQT